MTGILLVSHCAFAESLKDTLSVIIGRRKNVKALALNKKDRVESFSEKLKNTVEKLDTGDGVLIFADMFGGTPCNTALTLFGQDDRVKIMAGFNLPLVIEAVMRSDGKPDEIVKCLMDRRDKTIIDAKAIFKKKVM